MGGVTTFPILPPNTIYYSNLPFCFSSLCSLDNIVEYFNHIYTAEYSELPFNSEAPYLGRLATTSTWNAFEKQECLATSDHASDRARALSQHVCFTSAGQTCATINSLNVLLSDLGLGSTYLSIALSYWNRALTH